MKILLIEDEPFLSESMQSYFSKEGSCDCALTLNEGHALILANDYDCILLDLNLPDGDGLLIIEKLKLLGKHPIVIAITAKNSLDDKLLGLELGADDYITKPFHLSEINARIKAIARRKSPELADSIVLGNVEVLINNKQVFIDKHLINTTPKEYQLVLYLLLNKEKVVSKSTLVHQLWGDNINEEESFNFLFAQMKNVKKKLAEAGAQLHIRTVYGIGYQMTENKATKSKIKG